MPKKHPTPKTKTKTTPPNNTTLTKPTTTNATSQIPWPPLTSPKTLPYLQEPPTLTPLIPNQAYLIRDFFPPPLCKTYTSFLASLPLTTTPNKPKRGDAVRVNDRFQVQDEAFAGRLWETTALKRCVTRRRNPVEERLYSSSYGEAEEEEEEGEEVGGKRAAAAAAVFDDEEELNPVKVWGGEPLGLNGNIRIYRYTKGQFFDKHYDDSNTLTFNSPGQPARPARTTWTLLIYLTACEGGETIFYPEPTRKDRNPRPVSVSPEPGMALLHRHGEHCMLHEGAEVLSGEKWVLRSDLVVAR
ncbi:uncharacterized protein BP01DRAFT_367327 [Aspergillus saccharolyticus JOP 1030-1]|uniref:Fe2OG dioxygenase domain-containing protein n=1 Tax=Aspergillus saccharolyticus JOP 1030-1 TaxID=1450539 RepID=A0A319A962_9EURO|nr:hypothetical protein BP01DRAFT_367327 [Aspergillus saccharolyticus JOP 1030-1]PYH43552.1 hypothetical protein BP01DRAFT_367327 [Aspergillus saccharolyticus JOP 1030-1]